MYGSSKPQMTSTVINLKLNKSAFLCLNCLLLLSSSFVLILSSISSLIVPSRSPQFTSSEALDCDKIYVEWNKIPMNYHHGVLRGYKVKYKLYHSYSLDEIILTSERNQTLLTGLKPFSLYWIQINGFTARGDGPISITTVKTLEGGKFVN